MTDLCLWKQIPESGSVILAQAVDIRTIEVEENAILLDAEIADDVKGAEAQLPIAGIAAGKVEAVDSRATAKDVLACTTDQTRPPAGMQPFTLRHSAFAHHMQRSPYLSLLLQQPQ